jgi:diguanylate cyclase (GGDEF)-like protein
VDTNRPSGGNQNGCRLPRIDRRRNTLWLPFHKNPHPAGRRADQAIVRTVTPGVRACWWYVAAIGAATAAHQLLPATVRPFSYTLVSASTLVPISLLLRRAARGNRLPWWLLLVAMLVLTAGNGTTALGGAAYKLPAETIVTVGHAALLLSALVLVRRRGRNDVGGLIDTSVVLMGAGGLLWTALLQPRMAALGVSLGAQITLLVSVFVLTGVLGGLARLWFTGGRRLIALQLLVYALLLALVGNTALAMTRGSMVTDRLAWAEAFFMVAYLCVGAAALHPSVHELTRPGPAPVDRLSGGRLAFLGAAVVVSPVIGGGRELLGLPTDGLLMALGSLAVGPLVMLRIGRLSGQRERAEQALAHQATHDALTGLPNRAGLLARLNAALDGERAAGRRTVTVLFCDLDGFKAVNDRHGHPAGDRLLALVAERLAEGLRPTETLGRYGGDEFIVLCEDPAQQQAVHRLRRHIEDALSGPFPVGAELIRVGTSVGAATSDGGTDADELVRRADEAMYRAKQGRRKVSAAV